MQWLFLNDFKHLSEAGFKANYTVAALNVEHKQLITEVGRDVGHKLSSWHSAQGCYLHAVQLRGYPWICRVLSHNLEDGPQSLLQRFRDRGTIVTGGMILCVSRMKINDPT